MLILSGLFFTLQFGEALIQKGTWPFSTFSMYSEALIKDDQEVLFELIDYEGNKQYSIPLHFLPVDYYKGLIFLRKTFYDGDSPFFHRKETFFKMYLEWNNLSSVVREVNVYSVSLHEIVEDNYHWNNFIPSKPPIYSYKSKRI